MADPNDFGFLIGDWDVGHSKLRRRLAGDRTWDEFTGTSKVRPLLGGAANFDDNTLDDPAGRYRALTLRLYDVASDTWSIRWIDGRTMRVEPPMLGRFEEGIGSFMGEDHLRGRTVRSRFVWSEITDRSARWEQSFSMDGRTGWEVNWIMQFRRQAV